MQRRHGLFFAMTLLAAGCADDQGADDVDTSGTDPSSSSGPTSTVTPTTTITTDPSSSSDPSSSTDASSSSTSVDPDSSSGSGSSDSGSSDSGSSDSGSSDSGSSDSSTGEPVEVIVVINELSSNNDGEGGEDPIEIYNAGEGVADISGWIITDDISEPYDPEMDTEELVFPEGTTMFPGEFFTIYGTGKGLLHPFGLSGSGDTLRLFDAELATVDTVTYGDGEAAVSYCRMPDGPEGIWTPACTASFGASNG